MGVRLIDRLSEEQIHELHELYRREWWTHRREVDDVRRMLEHTDVVVAYEEEDTGRLAGFARVITDYVYKALVLDVIVEASDRGTGLGRTLMDAVIDHPRLEGVLHFELYCRPDLVPFYERWGFTDELGELRFMRRGQSPDPLER